jgi:hypothetical protein
MRGAAREMLCYVLTTIMHEKPWEEHGVETAPHLLTLFAFGGGPQSFSTEASPESIRRLVRYYRKLGFVRTSLSIAMLPRVFLGIQPMEDQKSFVLRIFNQDGEIVKSQILTMSGADYTFWEGNDQYVIQWLKSQLEIS